MILKTSYVGLAAILLASTTSVQAQQVPNIFSPNTPAVAASVNENFAFVADRLNELENLSLGFNLKDGERSLQIDCSSDPAALNQAYNENWQYRELKFTIIGDCYGDIQTNRSGLDNENNWDGTTFQPAGQTIHISPVEGQSAGIIANDLSGGAALYGGFGGGLYITGLTITMSDSDFTGLFWGRNCHGSVVDTSIIGTSGNGSGIVAQEGAQVYIGGASVTNTNRGVYALNNATVRFLSDASTFDNVNSGITLIGAVARSQVPLNITANNNSLELYGASILNAFGQDINIISGSVNISAGSTFQVQNFNASNSAGYITSSVIEVFGSATLASLYANDSKLSFNAGGISGDTNITEGSSIAFSGSAETPFTLQNIVIERTSTGGLHYVAVTNHINLNWGSSLNIENSSADSIYAESSTIRGVTLDIREIRLANEAFAEIDTLTGADSVVADSATVKLINSTLTGNVRGYANSTVYLNSSEVNGVEIGSNSAANITDSTIRGETSVVDFLDASIWVTRNSTLSIFGNSVINSGAEPIDVGPLSFVELDFGITQTLNGVEIKCDSKSEAYIPETADVTFSGCGV